MADELGQEILNDIAAEVEELDEESLREELKKLTMADNKRKARQQEYNKSPEAAARRKDYYAKTKEKRTAYRLKYNAKKKLMLEKCRQLGIDKEVAAEIAAEEASDTPQAEAPSESY